MVLAETDRSALPDHELGQRSEREDHEQHGRQLCLILSTAPFTPRAKLAFTVGREVKMRLPLTAVSSIGEHPRLTDGVGRVVICLALGLRLCLARTRARRLGADEASRRAG